MVQGVKTYLMVQGVAKKQLELDALRVFHHYHQKEQPEKSRNQYQNHVSSSSSLKVMRI